jgi:hypothetical protein
MNMPLTLCRGLPALLAVVFAACGGSDDTNSMGAPNQAAPTAKAVAGVFGGTLSDEKEYDLIYVVRGDGTKVGFFGSDWSTSFRLAGAWTSGNHAWSWTSQDGSQRLSFNGHYRGDVALVSTTFDMSVPVLSGSIAAGQPTTRTAAFAGGAIPGSDYKLDAAASLAAVQGRWELADATGSRMTLDIAPDGSLIGSYGGSAFAGSARPSATGENALLLYLDFEPPDPPNCRCSFNGFAIAIPMVAGTTRMLLQVSASTAWDGDIIYSVSGER